MDTKEIIIHLKTRIDIPIHLTGYTTTDSKRVSFTPSFAFSASPLINLIRGATIRPEIIVEIGNEDIQEIINTIEFRASADDSSGRANPVGFSSTENYLYIGNDGTTSGATRKAWLPFNTQFITDSGSGIHIVSARLEVMSASTQSMIDGKPCSIKLGCSTLPSSASPVAWSGNSSATRNLNVKNFKNLTTIYSGSLVESWVEGETYTFDVTNTIKDLFGAVHGPLVGITGTITSTSAVTWPTAGSVVAFLFTDRGSSVGSYRTIVSADGNIADATLLGPKLIIDYALNVYTDPVLDTFLSGVSAAEKSKVNYLNDRLYIGESTESSSGVSYKGLIKFDTASIPSSATVTSASMVLYLIINKASYTGWLSAHAMTTGWDLHGASWYTNDGINSWASGATGFSSSDYTATSSGSVSLIKNEALGIKQIKNKPSLTNFTDTIQGWVTDPTTNKGFALLMLNDAGAELANSAHIFASSQYTTASCRPKLIVDYTIDGTPYTKTIQTT